MHPVLYVCQAIFVPRFHAARTTKRAKNALSATLLEQKLKMENIEESSSTVNTADPDQEQILK